MTLELHSIVFDDMIFVFFDFFLYQLSCYAFGVNRYLLTGWFQPLDLLRLLLQRFSLVVSAELLNLSFRHLLDLSVYAIARLDDVAMPTCRTSDEAQCLLLNSPIRPCQLAQMYQYDRNQQQSLQAVLSGVGQKFFGAQIEGKEREKRNFPNEIANRLNFDDVPKIVSVNLIYRWPENHREFNFINMINTGERTTWLSYGLNTNELTFNSKKTLSRPLFSRASDVNHNMV